MDERAGSPPARPAAPIDLHALVHAAPALIGRDAEIARATEILDEGKSALVLVVGDTGMGKSAFLGQLEIIASNRDWAVARYGDAVELTVTPSTRPPEFAERLRQLLGLPAARAAVPARLENAGRRQDGGEARPTGVADSRPQGLLGRVAETARRWLQEAAWLGLADLIRDLQLRAPVLILVDGYNPNDAFERSFTGYFLPALRASPAPVVVVVAEREEPLSRLIALEPEVIRFGPVDAELIRARLRDLTRDVTPPVEDDELEQYAGAAALRPELIGSLLRLLHLQRAEAR